MSSAAIARASTHHAVPEIINTLGEREFPARLVQFLNELCGAEHCSIFRVTTDGPIPVETVSLDGTNTSALQTRRYLEERYWRFDSGLAEAQRKLDSAEINVIRQPIDAISHLRFRDYVYGQAGIAERILLTGRAGRSTLGVSVLKSRKGGLFRDSELARLVDHTPVLLATIGKHADLTLGALCFSRILSDLSFITEAITEFSVGFPRREAQVCARILYGMSTTGIALDLGIGEETVMTYRKRIYERLAIGSQRELLVWYIDSLGYARRDLTSMNLALH